MILPAREGFAPNHKHLRRIHAEEKLQVRRRGGRKLAVSTRASMTVPQAPNQRWSMDVVSVALAYGRRFRVLAIVGHHFPAATSRRTETSSIASASSFSRR